MNRRNFLLGGTGAAFAASRLGYGAKELSFGLTDVTRPAGIRFDHNNGAFGKKYLPETLGSGCAFLDYDNDGWQDILLINSMDWPGHRKRRSTLALYRNDRDGTFTDVTKEAGLDFEVYGMGVAVGDYDNDGFPDIYLTCYGQNRLLRNTGKRSFVDATQKSGLGVRDGFSTSATWIDFDRDGHLDLFVCNYVKWSPERDVFCSLNGEQKSYCTPEAYQGATCWLFRNRGNGTFEDVTAQAGLLDASSKSLGVIAFDYDQDGWPDLFVANDTQPNKLYRNLRNGKFQEIAVRAGVAFSEHGKARAGMGVDAADYDNSGKMSLVVTNFDNEMLALYRPTGGGVYVDEAPRTNLGRLTRRSLGFGCFFFDADMDGLLDLLVVNGHIDDSVRSAGRDTQYAQAPQLFLQESPGKFRDVASDAGGGFAAPKVGRGAAFADFDKDGDLDVLITTNGGPAYLYRNDLTSGNQGIRLRLIGTKSNRDAIGARVEAHSNGQISTRTVKGASSYLSQSELPVTFGLGKLDRIERVVITWPNGRVEEFSNLRAGRTYTCTEEKGISS
jgi:hypothetical protein